MKVIMHYDGKQKLNVDIDKAIGIADANRDHYNLDMLQNLRASMVKTKKITKADVDYVEEYVSARSK